MGKGTTPAASAAAAAGGDGDTVKRTPATPTTAHRTRQAAAAAAAAGAAPVSDFKSERVVKRVVFGQTVSPTAHSEEPRRGKPVVRTPGGTPSPASEYPSSIGDERAARLFELVDAGAPADKVRLLSAIWGSELAPDTDAWAEQLQHMTPEEWGEMDRMAAILLPDGSAATPASHSAGIKRGRAGRGSDAAPPRPAPSRRDDRDAEEGDDGGGGYGEDDENNAVVSLGEDGSGLEATSFQRLIGRGWAGLSRGAAGDEARLLNDVKSGGTGLLLATTACGWACPPPPAHSELARLLREAVRGVPGRRPVLHGTPRSWATVASTGETVCASLQRWLDNCSAAGVGAMEGAGSSFPLAYLLQHAMDCEVAVTAGLVTVTPPALIDTSKIEKWLRLPSPLGMPDVWDDLVDHLRVASLSLRGLADLEMRTCDFGFSCTTVFLQAWLVRLFLMAPPGTPAPDKLLFVWWGAWAAAATGLYVWTPTRQIQEVLAALARDCGLRSMDHGGVRGADRVVDRGAERPARALHATPRHGDDYGVATARPCDRCGAAWHEGHRAVCPGTGPPAASVHGGRRQVWQAPATGSPPPPPPPPSAPAPAPAPPVAP